jgi:cell division GTPase FtsZ
MKDEIRITVIATGFDAAKEQKLPAASGESKTIEFPKRTYDRDELDIPTFLRRARQQ